MSLGVVHLDKFWKTYAKTWIQEKWTEKIEINFHSSPHHCDATSSLAIGHQDDKPVYDHGGQFLFLF